MARNQPPVPQPSVEEQIGEAVASIPRRLPKHQPEEFEIKRSAIEFAPPSTRDDFTEAATAAAHDPQPDLPAERVKLVEQGLTAMQQVYADRDRLRRENANQRVSIAELQAKLDAGHERFLAMVRELREAKQREAQDARHSGGH